MSYILEALKKSQQERSRGQVPDIQTLHQSVVAPDTVVPRWPYWALGFCLLALAFLSGWLRPWDAVEKPVPVTVVLPPPEKKVASVKLKEPNTRVGKTRAVEPALQAAVQGANVPQPVMSPDAVADISQLPSMLQQAIPQLQFAGHVYSSNPQQRSVIINGRYMSEGDELMAGMKLLSITMDSVVFYYQGQQFKVTVLQDWSFK